VRIAALGGSVLSRVRREIADGDVERDVAALRAELASLRAELASAPDEHRDHIEERIDAVRTKLRGSQQRARALLDALSQESEAKIAWLEARAARAHGEPRERLEARIAEMRSRFQRRGEKVCQAWVVARQALG
jgi:chromosome segregation ATPase